MEWNVKYERFGVMLDMSRNGVMKVEEVKRFIDCISKMGYNMLELYTEDTYEIEGEPCFGYMRGRYTAKELKEIDNYALSHGVELIPCIQTLAHIHGILRYRLTYGSIIDVNDILLVDEPKTYALLDKMFATLAKNFTSRLVNIGMDEAHMVGLGKFLDKHGYQNRFEILTRHLNKVVEIAKKYGFVPHMWSDMFFRLALNGSYYADKDFTFSPTIVNAVPQDVELVYWDYYRKSKERFDIMFDAHKQFGRTVWFAGGAKTWEGFAPFNEQSLITQKPAMQSLRENGIKNVMITVWGDDGRECSYFAVLPSLYAMRQYADGNFDEYSIKKGFYEIFHVDYDDFMALDLPNVAGVKDANGREKSQNPCKTLFYADPFMGKYDALVEKSKPIPYKEHAQTLAKKAKSAGEYSYIFETLSALCSVLEIKSTLGVDTRRAYKSGDKNALTPVIEKYKTVEARLEIFYNTFYNLWHKENKAFGWEVFDVRLGGLKQRLKTCRAVLEAYANGEQDSIEELEEEVLLESSEIHLYNSGFYAELVSYGRLSW